MPHPARPLLFTLVALATATACTHDSTGPAKPPSRADLNGVYGCYRVDAYYYSAQSNTTRWRQGRCSDYIAVTNPSRQFERDTVLFSISSDNGVRRLDFATGELAYDSTSGTAIVAYMSGQQDLYEATPNQLVQEFQPFDFTGDGVSDSLRITFVKVN